MGQRWTRDFWNRYPRQFAQSELLRQVGKTARGAPVDAAVVEAILQDISRHLELASTDRLLDLCCGNGLLTRPLAERCSRTVAVDFSRSLIDVAMRFSTKKDLVYALGDVVDLRSVLPADAVFDKVLLYEGLQHLGPRDLGEIMRELASRLAPGARVLLGSIPDRRQFLAFHKTWRSRSAWLMRRLTARERFGRWWGRDEVCRICDEAGFETRILAQSPLLHTAHYRFDALSVRR